MNDHRSEPDRSRDHTQIEGQRTGADRHVGWRWPQQQEIRERVDSPSFPRGYGMALLVSLAVTFAAMPLLPYLDHANIVMLFLLAVVGVAAWYGRGPAMLVAILNVLSFNFVFVPPYFAFAFDTLQSILTFVVMLIVGLIVGQLTARFRHQAQIAGAREERARFLFTRWHASCPGRWPSSR